jgi:hypothetical protein
MMITAQWKKWHDPTLPLQVEERKIEHPRAYIFMVNVIRNMLGHCGQLMAGADQMELLSKMPMKLGVLKSIRGALMDNGVYVNEIHNCKDIGSFSLEEESWRVVKTLRIASTCQAWRYSHTNRVVLTVHGILHGNNKLLYAGEGQAIKAGGNQNITAVTTPVCGASNSVDRNQRAKFSRYLCWRSMVAVVDEFTEGEHKGLDREIKQLTDLYRKHMRSLQIAQAYTPTVLLDNIEALSINIRYPIMSSQSPAVLEKQLGIDDTNTTGMVLRRFLLIGFGLWNGGVGFDTSTKADLVYLHLVTECGVFLLCHKFCVPYRPNPRTLSVLETHLKNEEQDEEIKRATTLMYNALGTASQCVALLENRSSVFENKLNRILIPHMGDNAACIIQAYLPSFQ